jgi:hypothetical protein
MKITADWKCKTAATSTTTTTTTTTKHLVVLIFGDVTVMIPSLEYPKTQNSCDYG